MSDRDELQARWKELWGEVQKRWGELTDDEIRVVNGKYEQLVGLIQRRTWETREGVERSLGEIASNQRAAVAQLDFKVKAGGDQRPPGDR